MVGFVVSQCWCGTRQGCEKSGRMGWIVYRRIGLWLDKYEWNIVYNGGKLVS